MHVKKCEEGRSTECLATNILTLRIAHLFLRALNVVEDLSEVNEIDKNYR